MDKKTFVVATLFAVFLVALGASMLACGIIQPNRDNVIGGAVILVLGCLTGRLWMSIIWDVIEGYNFYQNRNEAED